MKQKIYFHSRKNMSQHQSQHPRWHRHTTTYVNQYHEQQRLYHMTYMSKSHLTHHDSHRRSMNRPAVNSYTDDTLAEPQYRTKVEKCTRLCRIPRRCDGTGKLQRETRQHEKMNEYVPQRGHVYAIANHDITSSENGWLLWYFGEPHSWA